MSPLTDFRSWMKDRRQPCSPRAARRAKQAHNATPTHNLPRQLTSVVGRATELADLARLQASTPLLTLADCHVVEVGAACAFADNGGTSQADC